MQKKREKGFGLMEAMLSLALIAMITILALRQAQHLLFERDAATIKSSVSYLQQGMNLYYFENCQGNQKSWQDEPLFPISISAIEQILQKNSINFNSIQNPWAANPTDLFTLSLNAIQNIPVNPVNSSYQAYWTYALTIQTTLNKSIAILPGIAGVLNATSVVGNLVTWTWIPPIQPKNADSGFWVSNPQLRAFSNYEQYLCQTAQNYNGSCQINDDELACPA